MRISAGSTDCVFHLVAPGRFHSVSSRTASRPLATGRTRSTPSLPCDFGGNRRQLVSKRFGLLRVVSGLETPEPFAFRCPLVFPQSFHPLPAKARSLRLAAGRLSAPKVGGRVRPVVQCRC